MRCKCQKGRCVLSRQPQKAIISKSFKCPKPLPCPAAGRAHVTVENSINGTGIRCLIHTKASNTIYTYVCLLYPVQSKILEHTNTRDKRVPQPRHLPRKSSQQKQRQQIIKANSQYQLSSDKRINYRKRTHIRASGAKATLLPITYLHIFCYSSSFQAPRPYRVA